MTLKSARWRQKEYRTPRGNFRSKLALLTKKIDASLRKRQEHLTTLLALKKQGRLTTLLALKKQGRLTALLALKKQGRLTAPLGKNGGVDGTFREVSKTRTAIRLYAQTPCGECVQRSVQR